MVAAVADVADEFLAVVGMICQGTCVCRRDEGDVGQVGAAEVGVVEDDDVPWREAVGEGLQGGLDGGGHRAEVDGLVGGLGDHFGGGVEEGAGEVLAFLHVGGVAGALEGHAHLLGDGDEHVLEDFEADGDRRAWWVWSSFGFGYAKASPLNGQFGADEALVFGVGGEGKGFQRHGSEQDFLTAGSEYDDTHLW